MNTPQRIVLFAAALVIVWLSINLPRDYGWNWMWENQDHILEERLHDMMFQVIAIAALLCLAFKSRRE